jgi:O-antigen/teichoic acid export membrane protein
MLFASIAALLTIGGVASVSGVDPSTQRYMVVMALGLLFQPFLVVDYGFQGRVQAKYSAIAKVTALALGSSLKLILVILDAHLSLLVFAYAVDPVLLAATLWLVRASQSPAGLFCRFDPNLLRSMWASAWPLMLSAAAAVLHVRIDQLMIMAMLGSEQLGLYASVGKIFEAWSLIPYLITISLLPALTRLRAEGDAVYQRNLVRLLSLVFWMGIGFAFAVWIVGDGLVRLLFGDEFVAAYEALKIMAVGAALVGFASVTARFLAVENMEGSIALRASAALAVNVSCNIILIPRFGIEGAALSSVISVFIAHYLLDYFGARTRSLLRMKHLAIVLPLNKSPRKYGVT